MSDDASTALRQAFDLVHLPSQVRIARRQPLPPGVQTLLRIAADDEEATRKAAVTCGRSAQAVREAATFFIEQAMFFPDADSYRVLGATASASSSELRSNMALLLRWLHPDLDRHQERTVLATRVTRAWNDLKTPERRLDYDRKLRLSLRDPRSGPHASHSHRGGKARTGSNHRRGARMPSSRAWNDDANAGFLRRLLLSLFGTLARR